MQSRPQIHILVVNYDGCTFSPFFSSKNMISPPLVAFAKDEDKKFTAWVGMTTRQVYTLKSTDKNSIYNANIRRLQGTSHRKRDLDNHWQTYRITENFTADSGLPCYGVICPEEYNKKSFGAGYEKVIVPFEKEGIENKPIEFSYAAISKQRGYLLRHTAIHTSRQHPDADIKLHYVDDNITRIKETAGIPKEPRAGKHPHDTKPATKHRDWPKNVSMNLYRHEAAKGGDKASIEFVKSIAPLPPVIEVLPLPLVTCIPGTLFNQHTRPCTPPSTPIASLSTSSNLEDVVKRPASPQ